MITFVFGVSGSGKSTYLENRIKADVDVGCEAYLIVPEQQTYIAERRYAKILPPSAQLIFEVVNFTRLANKAARQYGGLSYNYIDRGMKSLLMWHNLRELAPLLEEYGSAAGSPAQVSQLTSLMLAAVGELKAAAITPVMLEKAAERLPDESSLRRRLRDMALIAASYNNLVLERYDDAADDLAKLSAQLDEHNFFADKHVYIDSFTSYTAQEYAVMRHIFRQAASVTVTVGCDRPDTNLIHFASLRDTAERLHRLASECGGYEDVILGAPHRFASPDLALVEKYLWRMETPAIPECERIPAKNILLIRCPNPYAEAEAAANNIVRSLREGFRYRDIAVIMRDTERWRGVADAVFDKFGIPYFMSERTDLSTKPLIKLLLSALRIKNRGWRQSDVISYIKTGLCGIGDKESDIFEDYCSTWNINGAGFTGENWSMNPDGYTTVLTERGAEILRIANDVKQRLMQPLAELFTLLDSAENVRGMCRAIYGFTERLDVGARLDELAAREKEAGSLREAGETSRIYDIYIDTLDKIAAALPDERLDTEEFACALKIVFDNTDIGSLPTRQDEVAIGSASLMRADSPRLVIAMGLNEGEFPADIGDSGIFSSADRMLLGSLGIELSGDPAKRSSEELFFAYRALTAASDKLVLTCSEALATGSRRQPSAAFIRVGALFPELKVTEYDKADILTKIETPQAALEYLRMLGGTPKAEAVRLSLSKIKDMGECLKTFDTPFAESDCSISPDTAYDLFGDRLTLSQSQLESYVNCPFSYYCNYVLVLRDSRRAEFTSNRIGIFIHYVMEQFMREATRSGRFDSELTDKALESLADRIITEYAEKILPGSTERESRLGYLFARLRRIAIVMMINIRDEFRHSLFTPAFFELRLDGSDPAFPNPAEFRTPGGESVSLRGVVDRIDLFRRGKDVFIRVVDYKTGSKEYSISDIAEGLGLQLLLYLFLLCRTSSEEFREALGCGGDCRIRPAGALYLSADLPIISVDDDVDEETIKAAAAKMIKRSGPLLSDDEVLAAMNDNFDPDFLGGVKKDAKGVTYGKNLQDANGFNLLYDTIGATIGEIAQRMRKGLASASPNIRKDDSPCNWCSYGAVCRSSKPSKR